MGKSLKYLPENVSDQPVDGDWVSRFISLCQDTSDEALQELWAKLLAGEVAQPKSYSRRTLSILAEMNSDDASLFRRMCSLVWLVNGGGSILFSVHRTYPLPGSDVTYDEFLHMDSLGLLHTASDISLWVPNPTEFSYFGHRFMGSTTQYLGAPRVPIYPLTRNGNELFRVVAPNANEEYFKWIVPILKAWNGVEFRGPQ